MNFLRFIISVTGGHCDYSPRAAKKTLATLVDVPDIQRKKKESIVAEYTRFYLLCAIAVHKCLYGEASDCVKIMTLGTVELV
jgi:hypothetical protein